MRVKSLHNFEICLISYHRTDHGRSILHEAVYAHMETLGEGFHEDCVRAFFRLKVADLGEILPHVTELLKRNHRNLSHHIVEANQILLVCYNISTCVKAEV